MTDLERIVYGKQLHDLSGKAFAEYSNVEWMSLMTKFAEQMAAGCVYIHEKSRPHLDIKCENILVANEGGDYVCKLADFGMNYSPSGTEDVDAVDPYGTWEYLSP